MNGPEIQRRRPQIWDINGPEVMKPLPQSDIDAAIRFVSRLPDAAYLLDVLGLSTRTSETSG